MRILSNPVNLAILALVSGRPSYPREIARVLGRDETDVSKRLRIMEEHGLVEGVWARVAGRNIRLYRARHSEYRIRFDGQKITVQPIGGGEPIAFTSVEVESGPPRPRILVGRQKELEAVQGLDWRVLAVWGVAGVGKTSLVARGLSWYPVVFWYRSVEYESLETFLWRLGLYLARLGYTRPLRLIGQAPSGVVVDEVIAGLRETRSIVVIDDYHRVEDGELGSLARSRLAREADGYKLVLVSRRRPRGLPYHEPGVVREIRLGPLEMEDALRLARMHGASDGWEHEVYRAARGHPLLTIHLAGLRDPGRLGEPLASIREEILGGLGSLEERVLRILAVVGEPLDPGVIGEVAGVRSPERVLDLLERRGLIERVEDGYVVHELVAGLIVAGEESRRRVLEAVSSVLAARSCWHSRIRGARLLLAAGRAERASDVVVRRLLEDDYTVWPLAADYLGLLEELAGRVRDPARLSYVYTDLGRYLYRLRGDAERSLAFLEHAQRLARLSGDMLALAVALSEYSFILSEAGRLEEALERVQEAEEIVARVPAAYRVLFSVYANKVKALAGLDRAQEALAVLEKQEEVAGLLGDELYMAVTVVHKGSLRLMMGDYEEAAGILSGIVWGLKPLGVASVYVPALLDLAEAYDNLGLYDEMRRAVEEAEREGAEMGFRTGLIHYYKSRISLAEGKARKALEEAQKAMDELAGQEFYAPFIHAQIALARLLLGDEPQALENIKSACASGHPWIIERLASDLERHGLEHFKKKALEACTTASEHHTSYRSAPAGD